MAKTSTERMRDKKERERKKKLVAPESTQPFLKKPFSVFWDEDILRFSDYSMYLELAGIEPPTFEDERNPEDETKNADSIGLEVYGVENIYGNRRGAIGRAEVIIGCLIDAAGELAAIVNHYKRMEVKERLVELENSDETDKATAMKEAVRLNKILDQLDKQVRSDFPEWKVTGV